MYKKLTQPEEVDMVLQEFSDYFVKNELEVTKTKKSKSTQDLSDDEYYTPLYQISSFS